MANCVLHVHSVNGVAVSAQVKGVLPLSRHSIIVLSSLAYHDYEGVALEEAKNPAWYATTALPCGSVCFLCYST
jgi:ribulose-5-phosphate 4-epimerase/fuculose-1-phosphate aldolase